MAFQMEIYCNTHDVDDGYMFESGVNPYTGQYMERRIKIDDEDEEDKIDECAPMSKSEYDYWCNGMGYGR